MKKIFITLGLIMLFLPHIQAHDKELTVATPRLRLGIEAGADVFFGQQNKHPKIRENQSIYFYNDYYDYDFYCGFIPDVKDFSFFYLGIKPEYLIHKRLAIATGVRFSYSQFTFDSDKEYFLWKIREDETNTSYVKIKDITQKSYFFGVPVEIKFFPREEDYPVRHYFILGAAMNFLMESSREISFKNASMNKYSSDISEQIETNDFQGYIYAGFGLKIGKTNRPFGNIEWHFPISMYGRDKHNSLIKTKDAFGFGFQASLQIPIFTKHQLVYKVY